MRDSETAIGLSIDLVAIITVTVALAVAVVVPQFVPTAVRLPLVLLFTCLVPGYAIVAALFPERTRPEGSATLSDETSALDASESKLTGIERGLLAVACSLVVVPAIGYLLNFTPWGVRMIPTLVATSALTILMTGVAAVRRLALPPDDRFVLRVQSQLSAGFDGWHHGTATSYAVNAILLVAVVAFAVSAGYAVTDPATGEQYSELLLLTADGEEFAEGNLTSGSGNTDRQSVKIAVRNHEGRAVDYTVLAVEQTVTGAGENRSVITQARVERFDPTVQNGETWTANTTLPEAGSENTRLVWLLYAGDAPSTATIGSADEYVYLWLGDTESSAMGDSALTEARSAPSISNCDTITISDQPICRIND